MAEFTKAYLHSGAEGEGLRPSLQPGYVVYAGDREAPLGAGITGLPLRGYRWGRCRGRRPESGRVVPELGARRVRELIFGAYRVFYRVGSAVEVLSVRHGSRPIRSGEVNGD